MVSHIRNNLQFILAQIKIAEENTAGSPLTEPLPDVPVPFSLSAVSGDLTTLVADQGQLGAADDLVTRLAPDLLDGDAWLNVRISVRQNTDGTGPEIATFDSIEPMIPLMLDGTYNPGQLQIAREILTAPVPESDMADFDTAMFSGDLANYTIAIDNRGTLDKADDIVTVTDNVGIEGIDTLLRMERLQFADQTVVLMDGANSEPVGSLTVDGVAAEGQPLTVSIAGVPDADNVAADNVTGAMLDPVSYFWQVDLHGDGVLETVFSGPTDSVANAVAPVGAAGDDLAIGALSADQIFGDAGADDLDGGAGEDMFVFESGYGNDTITDFDAKSTGDQDILDLIPLDITAGDFGDRVTITDLGADTQVTIDSGETTQLDGNGANIIPIEDFLLLS